MADIEKLKRALINADRAGDVEAARKLAGALKTQMGSDPRTMPQSSGRPMDASTVMVDEMGFGLPGKASAGINALAQRGLAALPGQSPWEGQSVGDLYQQNRQDYNTARDEYARENPKTNLAAGLAGNLVGGGTSLKLGSSAARSLAPRVADKIGRSMPGRLATDAAAGSALGAVNAFGHDEGIGQGAALGAAGGAAGGAIARGVSSAARGIAGAFNKKPIIPSIDELSAAKTAAYDRADAAGVVFKPEAASKISQRVIDDLTEMGYDPAIMPGAAAAARRLSELGGQNVTLKGLDTVRKVASNGYVQGNSANNRAISKIINAIDDGIANSSADDILMGNAAAGRSAILEARDLASRTAKLDRVTEALGKAELRSGSTGSGGNIDNATRQNLRRILEKPRGLTKDEQSALRDIVMGTPSQNALRLAGKFAPTGVVSASLGTGAGYSMFGPLGAAVPIVGYGAKKAADRMTSKNTELLDMIIRAGGSRSATQAPPNAAQKFIDANKRKLIEAMIAGGAAAPTIQNGQP